MDDNNGIGAMRMHETIVCAKMSADERGVNGENIACGKKSPRNGISETNGAFSQKPTVQTDSGGRLRFFKDGKLIFELSHQKEGERASWVQVPKKTYWPPRGKCSSLVPVATAGSSRQESSASLSVSDDNSSVQSSPWQRDHCWKQVHPRKDAGRYLTFFMRPDARLKSIRRKNMCVLKVKRRRPLDASEIKEDSEAPPSSGENKKLVGVERRKLTAVVEMLASRAVELKKPASTPGSSKADHSVVSPRKRILREFERVSLEDQNNKRHKRPSSSSQVKSPSPPTIGTHINAIRTKGSYSVPASTPSPTSSPSPSSSSKGKERLGSYSISSLLGRSDEPSESEPSFLRSLLKSPSRSDQGSSGSSPSCVSSPQSPSEVRWRPPKKKVASPDPPPTHHLPFHQPFHGLGFFPPPAPIVSPQYFNPYTRGLWPAPHPAAPTLNYPANLLPLGASWGHHPHLGPAAPLPPQPFFLEPGKREELAADMPLNLSKNAG